MLLIIEDNADLVNLYKMAFGLRQIKPDVEMTGPSALRRIVNTPPPSPPQAVILDLHLKKEDNIEVSGPELFEAMRKRWPDTKIIVASADIVWCRKFEGLADAVVEKPITDMMKFLDLVEGMVDPSKLR